MQEYITPGWEPPTINSCSSGELIRKALGEMVRIYRRFGTTVFSNEFGKSPSVFRNIRGKNKA